MAKSSSADQRRRARAILIGHNLPWALFTGWALTRVVMPGSGIPGSGGIPCPMDFLTSGHCPGCGLTGAYATLLSGGTPHHPLLWPVLALFAASAVWSVLRARAVLRQPQAAIPPPGQPGASPSHITPA